MLGKVVVLVGVLLALYAVFSSDSLLVILSLALMFAGILWEVQLQIEEQQTLVEDFVLGGGKGISSWRLSELEDRLRRLERGSSRDKER